MQRLRSARLKVEEIGVPCRGVVTGGDFKAVMANLRRCLLVAFVEFAIANG